MKRESFVKNRLKSFKYAFRGLSKLIQTENSIKLQFTAAIAITIVGFVMQISRVEWMLQLLSIGLVLSIEGLNTAVEKIADFIHPEHHDKIGEIKDIAAGAVAFSALAALGIGLFIYVPKFIS
jgi:diacylglycerol kinase (ATP)